MLDKEKVERFITSAMKYLGNKYSQPKRLQKGYSDCSSLILKGLKDIGLLEYSTPTISTKRMRDGDNRFVQIPLSQAQRGDILWWQKPNSQKYEGHVAIKLGNGKALEAIYEGVVIKSDKRIPYQRAYRIKALEQNQPKEIKVTPENLKGEVITATNLNIREGNNTNYKIVGSLKKGDQVEITGSTNNNWYEIKFKNKKAFVSGIYIKIKKEKVIENVPILINNKLIKKGYIVNGITYITINKKDVPVRAVFEKIGAKVEWENEQVKITI